MYGSEVSDFMNSMEEDLYAESYAAMMEETGGGL